VPPETASTPLAEPPERRLRIVAPRPLRVVDVALFYGERSGGIRTYLDAKVEHARRTRAFEHHVIVPGPEERHIGGRHELPSLRVVAGNGYRVPLGVRALPRTLRLLRPDVVMLHDPFWQPLSVARLAHRLDARVVAVHHGSSELDAAGLPGPSRLYAPLFRAWLRRAYAPVDAVMSAIELGRDSHRPADLPLRLGIDPVFRPPAEPARGDHVLYVGRLGREKGVFRLLEAAALSEDQWPLRFVGSGPAEGALRARAERLGIARRVSLRPYVRDRARLRALYAGARCVVMPGEHETFGLVALEAAASGASVVACRSAPAAGAACAPEHRFLAGDARDLARAVAAARAWEPDAAAATALAERWSWDLAFAAELDDLRRLAG
jgi:alpha-1,6-mannosyltransferase